MDRAGGWGGLVSRWFCKNSNITYVEASINQIDGGSRVIYANVVICKAKKNLLLTCIISFPVTRHQIVYFKFILVHFVQKK